MRSYIQEDALKWGDDWLQALEKNVEKLIDELHLLGLKGVDAATWEAATQHTLQAIQDACSICCRPDSQVLPKLSRTICP